MKRLLIALLFLTISVWLALQVVHHPGDIFIVIQPWTIQMPIWFALLVILFLFGIFYLLISGIDKIYFICFRIKSWLRLHREQQSYSKTQRGLILLIEERWHKAERFLIAGVNDSLEPLMNYLGAAKAAHAQLAFDRRHTYIQKAHQIAPHATLAIGLVQAELEIADKQFVQAAAILTHLQSLSPRHPRVLSLLEKTYIHLGEWKKLEALLPFIRKAHLLTIEQADTLEKNIHMEILKLEANSRDQLQQTWKAFPSIIKKNPEVAYLYLEKLLAFSHAAETVAQAEQIIRNILKNQWHKDLVILYASLPFSNINRQLVIVGAWLKIHGTQPEILFALGKLCMSIQLWGKAKDYFEKSLHLNAQPIVFLEYGRLLEQLNEPELAMEKYKNGLVRFEK